MAFEMQESFVNLTQGCSYGESGWYTPFTDDRSTLYRSLVKEYGRCTGKVYVDMPKRVNGDDAKGFLLKPKAVGWVFVKRVEYDDAGRGRKTTEESTYLREVWVTVREKEEA